MGLLDSPAFLEWERKKALEREQSATPEARVSRGPKRRERRRGANKRSDHYFRELATPWDGEVGLPVGLPDVQPRALQSRPDAGFSLREENRRCCASKARGAGRLHEWTAVHRAPGSPDWRRALKALFVDEFGPLNCSTCRPVRT